MLVIDFAQDIIHVGRIHDNSAPFKVITGSLFGRYDDSCVMREGQRVLEADAVHTEMQQNLHLCHRLIQQPGTYRVATENVVGLKRIIFLTFKPTSPLDTDIVVGRESSAAKWDITGDRKDTRGGDEMIIKVQGISFKATVQVPIGRTAYERLLEDEA